LFHRFEDIEVFVEGS